MRQDDERRLLMEQCYQTFFRRLYLYALTLIGDAEEARDIVQEIFASLWETWESEEQATLPTSSFLYMRARNLCIDRLRHDNARNNYACMLQLSDHFESPDEVLEYEERISRLSKAIGELPEPGRSVLHCTYFKHMTYKQTAEALNLSFVVVRKQMLKVFKILHEKLNNMSCEV